MFVNRGDNGDEHDNNAAVKVTFRSAPVPVVADSASARMRSRMALAAWPSALAAHASPSAALMRFS